MKLHHIGYVVADIDRHRRILVADRTIKRLYDSVQKAELELLDAGGGVFLELIQPLSSEAFTWNFLQKGGGYHHLCFEIDNQERAEEIVAEKRMIRTLGPVEAPLLEGRVLFAYGRNKEVVEFLWHD